MIVDSSALVAIVRQEPDGPALARVIARAAVARLSAANLVELAVVIDGVRDATASGVLDAVLKSDSIIIERFTERRAEIAREANRRFGKGSGHRARLTMGDGIADALARDMDEPLLFEGGDFTLTDIEIVIRPDGARRRSEVIADYGRPASG